jgi:16S rRNA (cytidine1402-2'-O)-methyltransferase
VATPIGNLDDISPRALRVLGGADVIAAEDTRVTAHLLDRYGISGKLIAAHEHNERSTARRIVDQLAQGKIVALVTDAGTPAVSDPGAVVVAAAHAGGFKVVPIPGPSAAAAALSAAGFTDGPFLFLGFLPSKPAARRKALERINALPYTLVFYEAPHRIIECVEDMAATLGTDRIVVLARELTKLFEEIHRIRLGDAAGWLREDANRQRGEHVLVVEGAGEEKTRVDPGWEPVLAALLEEMSVARAVKLACKLTGAKKNTVYAHALQLAKKRGPGPK